MQQKSMSELLTCIKVINIRFVQCEQIYNSFYRNDKQHNSFNTDNKQICILEWFLKDHVTED